MPILFSDSNTESISSNINNNEKRNKKKKTTIEKIKQQNKINSENKNNNIKNKNKVTLLDNINNIKKNINSQNTTSPTSTPTTSTIPSTTSPKNNNKNEEIEILKNKKKLFESAITNEAKPLFNRMIKFEETDVQNDSTNKLKNKYKPINSSTSMSSSASKKLSELAKSKVTVKKEAEEEDDDDNKLANPKNVLFQSDQLFSLMKWKGVTHVGTGLNNIGNTCFMNSVLQCLMYTPPLANFMFSQQHSKSCKTNGFCLFCSLERLMVTSHKGGKPITPKEIASNIRRVAPTFRIGRQEDSHEFIRFVIEGLQKVCLSKHEKGTVSHRDAMTTVIGSIFGGYLRSQVKCSNCQYESNTFDPFMDLCVELNQLDSLEKGLSNFVKSESLDGSNKFKCSKCKKLVKADKRLQVHIAPPILTCQIKRFNYLGGKINKPITFKQELDLSPYMTTPNNNSFYDLYGVLVHLGGSSSSGHYFCYIKGPNGIWYQMDDSFVSQVSVQTALSPKAYMLFYSKRNTENSINTNSIITNTLPKVVVGQKRKLNDQEETVAIPSTKLEKDDKENLVLLKKQKTTTTPAPAAAGSTTKKLSPKLSPKLSTTPTPVEATKKSSPPMKSISLGDDELSEKQTLKHSGKDDEEESEAESDYSDESSLSAPSSESDNGGISPPLKSTTISSTASTTSPTSSPIINNHNKSKKEKKEEKKRNLVNKLVEPKVLEWDKVRYVGDDKSELAIENARLLELKKLKSVNNAKQLKENAKVSLDSIFNFNIGKWDDSDINIDSYKEAQSQLLKDESLKEVIHEKDEHNKHYDLGRVKKVRVKKSLDPTEKNQFNHLTKELKQHKENQLKFGDDYSNNVKNNKSNFNNGRGGKKTFGANKNGNRPKKFM